jgi:hypothetical protein
MNRQQIKNMKNRNIIQHKDGKPVYASRFEVVQHIILRNGWEYYLEETDKDGRAFGFVMGFESEWGDVYLPEVEPYIASIARGRDLNHIMPPEGYHWENEKETA